MDRLEFIVKVDAYGNPKGYDAERMRAEMQDHFGGSFAKIIVLGWTQTPDQMRKWYRGGILPTILKEMRLQGNPVHEKSREDLEWLHQELKQKFIPPQMDECGELILKNGQPVHTTKGMPHSEWHRYLNEICAWAFEQFGIELNPEKSVRRT